MKDDNDDSWALAFNGKSREAILNNFLKDIPSLSFSDRVMEKILGELKSIQQYLKGNPTHPNMIQTQDVIDVGQDFHCETYNKSLYQIINLRSYTPLWTEETNKLASALMEKYNGYFVCSLKGGNECVKTESISVSKTKQDVVKHILLSIIRYRCISCGKNIKTLAGIQHHLRKKTCPYRKHDLLPECKSSSNVLYF